MKIGTNPVGNYSPVYRKSQTTNIQNTIKAENTAVEDAVQISKKEKAFFSQMYPEKKEQIMSHHFYMKNGNMSGVTIGSLFDKRG
ncbi:MAG: hypothetical protein JW995_08030 [Melioribacteraceae bacterium]|nr:hypothetical protein [Melioribacteraceae bacterium]